MGTCFALVFFLTGFDLSRFSCEQIGALESLPEMHSLTLEASVLRPPRDLHALLPASSSLTAAPSRKSPATNVMQIDTQASTKSSDRWEAAAAAAAANTDDYSAEFNRKLSCFRRSTHWGAGGGGGGGVLAHTRSLQGKVMSSAAKSESTASATTEQSDNVAMATTLRQGAADHPSNCSWVPKYSATSMDCNIFAYSDRTPQRFFPVALQHHEPAAFSDSSSSPVAAAHGNLTAGSPGAAASCHGNYGFFYSPAAGASGILCIHHAANSPWICLISAAAFCCPPLQCSKNLESVPTHIKSTLMLKYLLEFRLECCSLNEDFTPLDCLFSMEVCLLRHGLANSMTDTSMPHHDASSWFSGA